jgi:hypothetical protein
MVMMTGQPPPPTYAFIVIGVGGGGRGVLNWLKYRAQVEAPELLQTGRLQLFEFDGPLNDEHYDIPGGTRIDTGPGSPEFYQFNQSPVPAIRECSQGRRVPYISDWLDAQDAQRISPVGIDPQQGFGQSRVPGRVTLFLEVSSIVSKIDNLLARAAQVPQEAGRVGLMKYVFLVGSYTGGTGGGTLNDIAHLIRSRLGERDRLVGILLLPNSYNTVQITADTVRNRDARAFAALREMLRSHGLKGMATTNITYSPNVQVSNHQLFDLCFLVDGEGKGFSLTNEPPIEGVCAAAADFIFSCVLNRDVFSGDATNWIQQEITPRDAFQRFSDFGIHSFIFPKEDVLRSLSLKFAVEFYGALLTVPPEEATTGFNLACEILRCTPLTELVVTFSQGNPVPLNPPVAQPRTARTDFEVLRDKYNIQGARDRFPSLDLDPIIRVDTWLSSVSDEEVREQCRQAIARIMGDPLSTDRRTVNGWLNTKNVGIQNEFANKLLNTILELFYDIRTEPPKPLPLDDKPYRLAILNNLLNELSQMLGGFKDAVVNLRMNYIDSPTNVIAQQQARLDEIERQMRQSGKRINQHLQRQYVQEAEILLELLAWRESILHLLSLLENIQRLVEHHRNNVGASAFSWIQLFQAYRNTLEGQLENLTAERKKREEIPVRTYFPKAGDNVEKQLYHDRVIKTNLHRTLLSQMHWDVVVEVSMAKPTELDRAMAAELILVIPEVPGFDRSRYAEQIRTLRNLATGSVELKRLSNHAPEEIVLWGRQKIQPYFDGDASNPTPFTIWDALWYDYSARWLPVNPGRTLNEYVVERVELLIGRSNVLFGHATHGLQQHIQQYAPDRTKEPGAAELMKLFQQEVTNRGHGFIVGASMTECVRVVTEHGADITQWGYYRTAHNNYRDYLDEYFATVNTPRSMNLYPITVCPEERLAIMIERHLVANRIWDTYRLLHPTVITYFQDHKAFRLFALAYLLDLFDKDTSDPERSEHHFYVPIETPTGQTVNVRLGRLWEIGGVLRNFLSPQNEPVRKVVQERYEDVYQHYRNQSDYPNNLKQLLLTECQNITFPEPPPGSQDPINREHLKWAMRAVVEQYVINL